MMHGTMKVRRFETSFPYVINIWFPTYILKYYSKLIF